MGYSIYDYYGMANDLQNRYDAAKNAGRSATTGATGLSFNTNAPFKTQPESTQTTTASVPTQQQASIYNYGGGEDSTSPEAYGPADLVDNPSPALFGYMANALETGMKGAVTSVNPVLGYGFKEGFDYAKDPDKYQWSPRSLIDLAINQFVPNVGSKYGGQIGYKSGGMKGGILGSLLGGSLQGYAQKSLLDQVISSLSRDTDPYTGQRGWLERGIDFLTGKYSPDKPTIGNPVTDPFLAVGPDTEVTYPTLGDPENDPYSWSGAYGDVGGEGSGSPSDNTAGWDWY